ncbi:unnamed protein product [Leuciscus chuanchicus]
MAKLLDQTGTELDEDVFEEVLKQPDVGVLLLKLDDDGQEFESEEPSNSSFNRSSDSIVIESPPRPRQHPGEDAKALVQSILEKKPGGDIISKEYRKTKYLTDSTRRKMITILVDMTERHGTSPPRHIRERYAEGIIALFPCLRDPFSKKGYEHYFDPQSGEGYLSWEIKNIQRNWSQKRAERRASNISDDLSEEECKDAISFMKHWSDETTIKQKMQATFQYRRCLIEDPNKYGDVLLEFPRFKDMKGLIEQDFTRLFGGVVSAKFLEKWPTAFKHKIIAQSKGLRVWGMMMK